MICFKNGLLGRELLELYSQINDYKMSADTENPQVQLCPADTENPQVQLCPISWIAACVN